MKKGGRKYYFGKLSLEARLSFISNLATILHSGLSITEGLDIIADQSSSLSRIIAKDIYEYVSAGNTLADSFLRHPKSFPRWLISVVRAGELSGSLEANLIDLSTQLKKEKEFRDKIKGSLTYPALVLSVSFILIIFLSIFVLPKIIPIFTGLKIDLPNSTKVLILFSDYVQNHTFLFLLETFGSVILLFWLKNRSYTKLITHRLVLQLPILGSMVRFSNNARFSRTMASLLKSGISIDEALLITGETLGNIYYQKTLKEIALNVQSGDRLSEGMTNYKIYFSKLTISMIRIAEKSGNLEETFLNLAEINENKFEQSTKTISELFEPLFLLIVGAIVAWIAIAVISPIYEITGSVYK